MEKKKSSKPLNPSDKGKTSSGKKLRQPANAKRKKAEEEVERFASFPKLNPNPILEVDSSGNITFHNDAAVAVLKKFNLSEDASVFLPEDIKELLTGLKQKKEGQFYRELIIKGKVFEETIYLVPQFDTLRIYAVDITERKRAGIELQVSESKYHSLFANMMNGFAYHQILLNKKGKPVDYVFLEINDAFEKLTGLKKADVVGKKATEIIPGIKDDPADWIGMYGKVALTGQELAFENYSEALKKWFSVSAYSPQKGYFAAVFDDITERKRVEEKLNRENQGIALANRILEVFVKEAGDDLYDSVLNIILKETASSHGVFGYIAEPGHLICPSLSKMLDECEVEGKCIHYPPEKWKGLWARALREKRSLYTNKPSPVPRGHPLIHNNLAVPILFRGEAIGLLNLANKKGGYTETDWETLESISGHIAPVLYAHIQKDLREKERKQAEDSLLESEERLRRVLKATGVGLWMNEMPLNRLNWDAQTHELFFIPSGVEPTIELFWSRLHPEDREPTRLAVEVSIQHRTLYAIDHRAVDPVTGRVRWIRSEGQGTYDINGRCTRFDGLNYDITERKRMEDEIRRSRDELEREVQERTKEIRGKAHIIDSLFTSTITPLVLLDRDFNFIRVNEEYARVCSKKIDEFYGHNHFEFYPHEVNEAIFRRVVETKIPYQAVAKPFTFPDDPESRVTYWDWTLTPLFNADGEVNLLVFALNDVTERKEAENRNHFITQILALFVKKTSRKTYLDAVVGLLHDWTGCRSVGIRVVNKERYIPYDAFVGFSDEFMHKENMISLDSDACACIRVINGKFEPQDAPVLTPNGSFRLEDSLQFANQLTEKELSRFRGNCIRSGYASIAVIPIRYHNKPLGAIHLADEKKNMVPLDAIQFLESMAAPLIGEAIYRFSAEEELTQHRNHLEEIVKERTRELHDIQEDLNRAQTVAHTGSWRLDVTKNELLWSDENWRIFGVSKGTALTYETFLSTIHPDDREYVDKQWKAALQGEPYDIEHRIVVDGQVKWVREKARLEFDEDNNLKGGFGTTQDITEMKQAEKDLQTLMEELKRSNSDLEQFAYAASHDLQEPLRVVAGFVSLLEKKYKEKLDDKAHEYIEYSIDGVKRMQVLIKDLLAYSQVGTKGKTFKPTICSVALEQAIYNLHTAIEESGAEITYDRLPTVSADTSQLTRLFQNLIGNAIKFRAEERLKIHITAERKGNEWVFSIRDNGIGIDPKFFDRIFVVFQRLHTREEYEGTGIGLAVCKKIVERHGGHIWVESEQGKGTTFYFTMPVMA